MGVGVASSEDVAERGSSPEKLPLLSSGFPRNLKAGKWRKKSFYNRFVSITVLCTYCEIMVNRSSPEGGLNIGSP